MCEVWMWYETPMPIAKVTKYKAALVKIKFFLLFNMNTEHRTIEVITSYSVHG